MDITDNAFSLPEGYVPIRIPSDYNEYSKWLSDIVSLLEETSTKGYVIETVGTLHNGMFEKGVNMNPRIGSLVELTENIEGYPSTLIKGATGRVVEIDESMYDSTVPRYLVRWDKHGNHIAIFPDDPFIIVGV